jgi:hypothetical protein
VHGGQLDGVGDHAAEEVFRGGVQRFHRNMPKIHRILLKINLQLIEHKMDSVTFSHSVFRQVFRVHNNGALRLAV